jgi:ubiquinone/menaquinone biosynthesis C-methylase UbiE
VDPLLEAVMFVNRMFPRAPLARRASEDAYSEWEHRTGGAIFERCFGRERLRGVRLLDAACGPGGKTVWYAESGADLVVGVDLDPAHLRQAGRFAAARGAPDRLRFVAADVLRLPFVEGAFDAVTANDAMEHFADPAAALRELARIVRPGGRLFLTFQPFRSAFGAHLYDYVKIPWCQVLLPQPLLYRTLERSVLEAERSAGGNGIEDRARARYRDAVAFYEDALNRITVARFHAIVRAEPRVRAVRIVCEPPRAFLRAFTSVPGLRELFTGMVVAELERVEPVLSSRSP